MTKVKVLKFEVSNCAYTANEDDFKTIWYKNNAPKLVSYEEVEETINDFLKDKNYIDMKVTTVDSIYSNNGRSNKIILVYSIVYSEKETK